LVDIDQNLVYYRNMLEGVFGNKTAERVLLHVYHYGEIHASAIAQDYGMAINPVKGQLDRFERAGILASKEVGRTRLYFFNPKSVLVSPIRDLLKIVYETIPLKDREQIFGTRRRPRRKGKPVL
jgi:predicted transcriptional regulator